MDKLEQLKSVSDPGIVALNAYNYYKSLGVDSPDMNQLFGISNHKFKKYKIFDIYKNKYIHFGDIRYHDFTKSKNDERRQNYLNRSASIKGDWESNPFSPNMLARKLLW